MTRPAPNLKLALEVHGRLSELLAPATPQSIRASSFLKNRTLLSIAVLGLLSFVGFIVPIIWVELFSNFGVANFIQVLAAAGLGSSFYSLYTANRYIRARTFDPTYNQVYLIRFVLGVFAGAILGYFAQDLVTDEQAAQITPTTLALVGGFSAEAVAQILQRVADTLVTLVRGSGKDRAEAEAEKRMAQTATKISRMLQEALGSEADEAEEKIREAIRELTK